MSLTKRVVAAGGGVGATPTSSRAVSLSQKKRGTAAGEHHAKGTDAKVSESGHAKIKVTSFCQEEGNTVTVFDSVVASTLGTRLGCKI